MPPKKLHVPNFRTCSLRRCDRLQVQTAKSRPGLAPIYSFVICNILVVELVPEKPGFSILLVPQRIYLFCASTLNNHQIRAKIWKTFFNFACNQFFGRFWVHFYIANHQQYNKYMCRLHIQGPRIEKYIPKNNKVEFESSRF